MSDKETVMNDKQLRHDVEVIDEFLGGTVAGLLLQGLPHGQHPEWDYDETLIQDIAEACMQCVKRHSVQNQEEKTDDEKAFEAFEKDVMGKLNKWSADKIKAIASKYRVSEEEAKKMLDEKYS